MLVRRTETWKVLRFLPEDVRIIGYARTTMSDAELHDRLKEYLQGDALRIKEFLDVCTYQQGQVRWGVVSDGVLVL